MGLPKGRTNNPYGRPEGSRNKVTTELKTYIQSIIEANADSIQSDIESLEPRDRLKFLVSLLNYVLPKPQEELPSPEPQVIKVEGMSNKELEEMVRLDNLNAGR